jgi:hypothetical protein
MRQLLLQMSPEVSEKRMLVCSYTNNEEHGGERSSEGASRGMVAPVQGVPVNSLYNYFKSFIYHGRLAQLVRAWC